MGLAVSVGVLADLDDNDPEGLEVFEGYFEQVNRVLAANGLPAHDEPGVLREFNTRASIDGFPYSWIHYLRRALAYARQAPAEFTPVEEGVDPAQDPRIDEELSVFMDSHFICHSDCEGMYVPVDFAEVLFDDELPGAMLGSSQRAFEELKQVARLIDIPLKDGVLSDSVAEQIDSEGEGGDQGTHPYWKERLVWLTMYEAFRLSIEHKSAVVFQ